MIKVVIFDMDGVIFDTEKIWKEADMKANEAFNIVFPNDFKNKFSGMSEDLIKDELKKLFPNLDVDQYRKFVHNYVLDSINNNRYEVKKGFFELVNYLKNNNYKIALATSSNKEKIQKLFGLKNIDLSIFDFIVSGDEVGKKGKPNPYIFTLVSKHFLIEPKDICVLEDSINGIKAAVDGGFKVCMVIDLINPDLYCKKNCDRILENLNQVIDFLKICNKD